MDIELSHELLLAAHDGDRRSFNKVGLWMTRTLLAFYAGQGRPLDDANELTQRTLKDILEKFEETPDDPELFRSFVERFAVISAKRKHSNAQRHENKRAAAHAHPRTPARRPDSMLSIRRLLARVRAELSKLPSPYRHALGLTLEHDNHRQIADELDETEERVRWRVWKARDKLNNARQRSRRTSKRFRT